MDPIFLTTEPTPQPRASLNFVRMLVALQNLRNSRPYMILFQLISGVIAFEEHNLQFIVLNSKQKFSLPWPLSQEKGESRLDFVCKLLKSWRLSLEDTNWI